MERSKKAVVLHSGGMDSSICLALAIEEFGKGQVTALSFSYQQRHPQELIAGTTIARALGVTRVEIDLPFYSAITKNALLNKEIPIEHVEGAPPNTLVIGRNGLMAQIAGIYAASIEASTLFLGVMGIEGANSGYRDCSRSYMDLVQSLLRIDLDNPSFEIRTPLVAMTKKETLGVAQRLGFLSYFLEETVTCYEGVKGKGCEVCPACLLRNEGIAHYFNA